MNRSSRVASLALLAVLLSACAGNRPVAQSAPPVQGQRSAYAVQYGEVRNIETLRGEQATTGGGALAGGVIGAVLGRQLGSPGSGRAAGTVVGAVGGAIIGNQIEKGQGGRRDAVRVSIRLDDGTMRSFDYEQLGDLRVGDRVRIEGDQVVRI